MGHRCNYAVRDRGEVTVYYSHWGALTILRDVFWGLDGAKSFLAQQELSEDGRWLDDVWGEGGASIDLDTKTVTIDDSSIHGATRALAFEIMREIWAQDGFTVREAASFVDIATAVGEPAETVEADHFPSLPIDVTNDGMTGRDTGVFHTLVSIDGTMRFTARAVAVLELGPERVDELQLLPGYDEANKRWEGSEKRSWEPTSMFGRIHDVVIIDTAAMRIECQASNLRNTKARRYFEELWRGWTLVVHSEHEGQALRVRAGLPGTPERDKPEHDTPEHDTPEIKQLLGELERYLLSEAKDMGAWFREVSASLMTEPGGWVNPHAVKPTHDGRPHDPIEANARFRAALHTVLSRRRSS